MPIDIRSRIPVAGVLAGGEARDHYLAFYGSSRQGTFNPAVVVAAAQEQERLGFDSSLFPQRATGPAVWPVVAWALSATRQLKVIAAHRVGIELPTVAARTAATLDRLSNGRLGVHVLQGREDADMQRDGVFLDKAARYVLAHEYLEVFLKTFHETQPFNYQGDAYRIEGAYADVRPISQPGPVISIPGTSDAGVDLAARYADVYSVPIATLDTAKSAIARIQARAQSTGRRRPLSYWADCNVIIGQTDEEAWRIAHHVAEQLGIANGGVHQPAYDHGNAQSAVARYQTRPDADNVWFAQLNVLSGHGYTMVGSVTTLAHHLLEHYAAGISTLTLGGIANRFDASGKSVSDPDQLRLLGELIEALHRGAKRIDATHSSDTAA